MDLPVCKITWILLLTVCFNCFNGISARCKLILFETPSMPLCESGVVSRGPGEFIYIDTSGAPDFSKVECSCDLTFSTYGIAAVSYRVENETFSDCPVNFKTVDTDVVNWGCQPVTTNFIVIPATYKVTYTKSSSSISDWDACIGILPSSVSVTVTCYPYRLISTPEQGSSTMSLAEKTLTTTEVLSEQTSTTKKVLSEQTSTTKKVLSEQTSTTKQALTTAMTVGERGINNQQISSNILGTIVGGVIGGVALVALVVIATCFLTKTGENSLGQGKNSCCVATLGKGGNDYVLNGGLDIFLPSTAQRTTQFQEDIDPYDYIDDKHVRISKVGPTVPPREDDGGYLKPVDVDGGYVKPVDVDGGYVKPVDIDGGYLKPVDVDGGYLQSAEITKVQYSDLAFERKKTDKGENQYITLQQTEVPTETTADDYLHPV